MTTGKTDEPDYKAHAEKTADRYRSFMDVTKMNVVDLPRPSNPESACKQIERLGELLRLQQVVIEAAKRRRRARDNMFQRGTIAACDKFSEADNRFENTLTTLLEFEANQK